MVNIATYNALLVALCKGGELEEAGRMLTDMREVHGSSRMQGAMRCLYGRSARQGTRGQR